MMWYFAAFSISLLGIWWFYIHHRQELTNSVNKFPREATFAFLMDTIMEFIFQVWYQNLRKRALILLEKRLRWSRIFVLRTEHFLLRVTRRVRDASIQETPDNSETHGIQLRDEVTLPEIVSFSVISITPNNLPSMEIENITKTETMLHNGKIAEMKKNLPKKRNTAARKSHK